VAAEPRSHIDDASRRGLAPSPTCLTAARWFPRKWDVAVSTANIAEWRQPSLRREGSMTAPIPNHHHDSLITRRSIFIGAAASLICAPAIVRATSLMPVRSLPLPSLNPLGEFYRRCFYHDLDFDLKTGRRMSLTSNGKIVSEAEGRRMVAYARAQGWLPTPDLIISGLT
jgi:hypothetical protein